MINHLPRSLRKLLTSHRQFVVYSVIGATGATLDFVTFLVLYNVFHIDPSIATTISVSIGIINNFFLNVRYNFKVRTHLGKRFLSFYSVGLLGILVSILTIYLLHNIGNMSANLAKLLSIPLVVIIQYTLNKHVTFGLHGERLAKRLRANTWLIALNVFVLLCVGFAIKHTVSVTDPTRASAQQMAKQPPDESTHFAYNVNFILTKHRLPVSGKDDVGALSYCHTNDFSSVPCMYSYTVYPAVPYILGAIGAAVGQHIGIHPVIGARLPGFLYAFIMVNFLYLALVRVTRQRNVAVLLTATVMLIPQILYTLSYLNTDGFSLAIVSILGYAIVRFIQEPDTRGIVWLGVAFGGLLPNAKYNYFMLAVPVLVTLAYLAITSPQHRRKIVQLTLTTLIAFIALASFWYVRNFILYHDAFGQSFTLQEMSKYHPLGQPKSFSLDSISQLYQREFLGQSFRSLFVSYGPLNYFISIGTYDLLGAGLFGLAAFALVRSLRSPNRRLVLAWMLTIGTLVLSLLFSMYNSLRYDFQPQGRYLFPVLIPVILYLAYHWRQDTKAFRETPLILFCTMVYIFILGTNLYIRVYL